MLSYQHAFHAGNHADILKHTVLFFVLDSLLKKEKPFTFFDTHAGSGLYDLLDSRSIKTGESEKGIQKLLKKRMKISGSHPLLDDYLSFIEKYTLKNFYPGSPEIERARLREQDFLILSELHPKEIENLYKNIQASPFFPSQCRNIQIHARNGFEMLNALTPPKTKRGAVLIDPSYEEASDYTEVSKSICAVHKKWSNGIIMLWYPLLLHRESEINLMLSTIKESVLFVNPNTEITDLRLTVFEKYSHTEMSLSDFEKSEKNPPRLYGSGMLVINAPWKLQETVEEIIPALEEILK